MAAPKGNQFWKARAKHGRDKIFKTPELLWESCCEYFEWCENNPLWSTKSYMYQGVPVQDQIPKMRAMTKAGLCIFLDIEEETWDLYRARQDFIGVTKKAESIIYAQKFAGAAADELNANIIARDLGLADKKEVKSSANIKVAAEMSAQEASRAYQDLMGEGED